MNPENNSKEKKNDKLIFTSLEEMKNTLADHCSDSAHNGGSVGIGAGAAAETDNRRNTLDTLHRVGEAAVALALVVEGMDIQAAVGIPRTEVEELKGSPKADSGHVGTLWTTIIT
ncbi:hypothetical protein SAY87_021537 [Trapa incisa]|uniref:Uncharacterized protein n=1 Tax=Trapa incisa TaxID=236973 RepID=A0AAN7JS42_9MYRT|nr:hypothetical protein SAY87_021537 [Trapa incisa]